MNDFFIGGGVQKSFFILLLFSEVHMMMLVNLWWLWMVLGFGAFLGGAMWSFRPPSLSRFEPYILVAMGTLLFWAGIACLVGPWLVKNFGH